MTALPPKDPLCAGVSARRGPNAALFGSRLFGVQRTRFVSPWAVTSTGDAFVWRPDRIRSNPSRCTPTRPARPSNLRAAESHETGAVLVEAILIRRPAPDPTFDATSARRLSVEVAACGPPTSASFPTLSAIRSASTPRRSARSTGLGDSTSFERRSARCSPARPAQQKRPASPSGPRSSRGYTTRPRNKRPTSPRYSTAGVHQARHQGRMTKPPPLEHAGDGGFWRLLGLAYRCELFWFGLLARLGLDPTMFQHRRGPLTVAEARCQWSAPEEESEYLSCVADLRCRLLIFPDPPQHVRERDNGVSKNACLCARWCTRVLDGLSEFD